jgi:hypothetical protein
MLGPFSYSVVIVLVLIVTYDIINVPLRTGAVSASETISSLPVAAQGDVGAVITNVPASVQEAYDFIHRFQNSVQCSSSVKGQKYVEISMGIGGGFAAQFQLAAAEWVQAAAFHNFSVPVIIVGKLIGYSDCPQCDHVNRDWTCFFQQLSICQQELVKSGQKLGYGEFVINGMRHHVKGTVSYYQDP